MPSSDNLSISWTFIPDPDKVDQCQGNCGAGCGSFFSAGGGEQKWHYTITGPARFAGQTTTKATCQAGQLVETLYNVYTAPAHFEYHGKWSDGCDSHDSITRWNFIPGVAILAVIPYDLTICSGAFDKVWAYDAVVTGISTLLRTQTGDPCGNSR